MIAQLPFTALPSQTVTVPLDSGTFDFFVLWNERLGVYSMTITESATQVLLVSSIPLVLGASLLGPFNLGIGYMFVYAEDGVQVDAAFADLGVRINVYYASANTDFAAVTS
jgi:hypothetical protein